MTHNARHVTAAEAIAYVHYLTDGRVTLNINLIRVWAHRDNARVGSTRNGFALYDLEKIIARVRSREAA